MPAAVLLGEQRAALLAAITFYVELARLQMETWIRQLGDRLSGLYNSPFGRVLLGIIKLVLFPVLLGLITAAAQAAKGITITIGNQQVDLSLLVMVIGAFAPLLLLISALQDLGVRL